MSSSLSREHPLVATVVMEEFSFAVTLGGETIGENILCASDTLHGLSVNGKDWNELMNMIVDAIYRHKGREYKVCFNYIPEPGEEDAVLAAIKRDMKKEWLRRKRLHCGGLRKRHRGMGWDRYQRWGRYKDKQEI